MYTYMYIRVYVYTYICIYIYIYIYILHSTFGVGTQMPEPSIVSTSKAA